MRAPRTRWLIWPFLVPLLTLITSPAQGAPTSLEGVPVFGHVFVIMGENTELGQINATNSPYLIGTIKPESAWLTNYFALTHFSEANYVGMTAGQFTSCQQFDGSVASCHWDVDNLFHQLDVAGVSWTSWMESMPSPCYLTSAGGTKTLNHYAPKHNPALFFDDVEGSGGVWSATNMSRECLTQDIPAGSTKPNDMSAFDSALAKGKVARFNYIVPNECEDAHDNCSPSGNSIGQFDAFLAREVPKILASKAFGSDGVLIVTFDEGTSNKGPQTATQFQGGGNVVFAVVSPLASAGQYGGDFNHYSFLRTMEDGFGISSYLANAASASPISAIWPS